MRAIKKNDGLVKRHPFHFLMPHKIFLAFFLEKYMHLVVIVMIREQVNNTLCLFLKTADNMTTCYI